MTCYGPTYSETTCYRDPMWGNENCTRYESTPCGDRVTNYQTSPWGNRNVCYRPNYDPFPSCRPRYTPPMHHLYGHRHVRGLPLTMPSVIAILFLAAAILLV